MSSSPRFEPYAKGQSGEPAGYQYDSVTPFFGGLNPEYEGAAMHDDVSILSHSRGQDDYYMIFWISVNLSSQ